jgi:hypothetical protein
MTYIEANTERQIPGETTYCNIVYREDLSEHIVIDVIENRIIWVIIKLLQLL